MEEIKITLETLYDLLRNEKKREELQELEETFFVDTVAYLQEKKCLLGARKQADELFAAGEREKVEYELRSIQRILKELYEKREKKIIEIALNRSKTGSDLIDTSSMLSEEKEFYKQTLAILDGFRREVLFTLLKGELPSLGMSKSLQQRKKEIKAELEKEVEENDSMTKVKFVHPTPSFVWKDMKVYGPYDIGDEIEIFPEVADLLVRKGRAEKV
jgi:DNA replication initiation complex subunit (GINS family)